tara:strand:+ start:592 stop:732 length:141 start_codon:yes stop_codon:yes gene_type:complete
MNNLDLSTLTDKEVIDRYREIQQNISVSDNNQMAIKILMNSFYGGL